MSTEPILSNPQSTGASERCTSCGAPLAADQRYCLECGERRLPMSSVLSSPPPTRSAASAPPPSQRPDDRASEPLWQRQGLLTILAGIGVLLLAMGVGVLIGRSGGSSTPAAATPSVITVGQPTSGTGSSGAEATFASTWPSGTTKGYTVELQTLPATGTSVSAVEAAKSAATAKGAKGVGALKSEEFSSLPSGQYVIYAGVYHKRSEAQKALTGLKKSFAAAKVVEVSNGSASGSGGSHEAEPTTTQPGGTGQSINHPAPSSVLEGLHNAKGKNYVEKAKNLPNVVETG